MAKEFEALSGKWALILGVSSGFGAAVARSLSQSGMHILGVHLDRKSGMATVEALASELESNGSQVHFFNINASDAEKRSQAISEMKNVCDHVQVLVHSLAFGALKPFFPAEPETPLSQSQMDMTLDVMANSLVYWTQDLLSQKLLGEGSRIYAMTSAGSTRVWKSYGAVSAAKSALESHIRQLALELAPHKITANAIRAGVTDTPALRKIPGNPEMLEMAQKKNPHHRLTTPEDIGACILALSLPHTHWLTGNVLGVDGGENIVD